MYLCRTKTFCVVYVFAVAHNSHVNDSSDVSVGYFFYMSCIFSIFFISFLCGRFTPKEVHIQSMYYSHLWWISIYFDLCRETAVKKLHFIL